MNSVARTMKSLSSRIKHWDGGDGRYKRIWFFFAFNMQIWLGEELMQLTADIHRQSYKCLRQRCVAWIEVFDLNELDLHICVTFFIFYAGERWRINHRLWKKKQRLRWSLKVQFAVQMMHTPTRVIIIGAPLAHQSWAEKQCYTSIRWHLTSRSVCTSASLRNIRCYRTSNHLSQKLVFANPTGPHSAVITYNSIHNSFNWHSTTIHIPWVS